MTKSAVQDAVVAALAVPPNYAKSTAPANTTAQAHFMQRANVETPRSPAAKIPKKNNNHSSPGLLLPLPSLRRRPRPAPSTHPCSSLAYQRRLPDNPIALASPLDSTTTLILRAARALNTKPAGNTTFAPPRTTPSTLVSAHTLVLSAAPTLRRHQPQVRAVLAGAVPAGNQKTPLLDVDTVATTTSERTIQPATSSPAPLTSSNPSRFLLSTAPTSVPVFAPLAVRYVVTIHAPSPPSPTAPTPASTVTLLPSSSFARAPRVVTTLSPPTTSPLSTLQHHAPLQLAQRPLLPAQHADAGDAVIRSATQLLPKLRKRLSKFPLPNLSSTPPSRRIQFPQRRQLCQPSQNYPRHPPRPRAPAYICLRTRARPSSTTRGVITSTLAAITCLINHAASSCNRGRYQ